jgi:hypothetical protein
MAEPHLPILSPNIFHSTSPIGSKRQYSRGFSWSSLRIETGRQCEWLAHEVT